MSFIKVLVNVLLGSHAHDFNGSHRLHKEEWNFLWVIEKKNKLKDNIFTIRLLKNFSVSLFVLCFVTPLKPWNWNASFHRSRELAIWENIPDWIRTKSQLKSFTRNPPPRCFHMRIAFKWFFSKVGGRMVVVDYTNPRNLMLKSRQAELGWPNRRLCCEVIAVNFLEYV